MKGIAGKVAVVTGGSSGIGRAAALAFGEYGARVVVASRREQECAETVDLIRRAGGEALFIRTDVSRPSEIEALIEGTVAAFGRLDFAFNNAGVSGELMATADATEENWDLVMSVNLKGLWLCMKHEIRQMLKQGGGGSIVNMSSAGGLVGLPGASAYIAAKHGVVGLTKTAALEYAKAGIRINAICPGGILTEMVELTFPEGSEIRAGFEALHPIGRLGRIEEIGPTVVWLCSEHSSFTTGQSLAIDGGVTAG